MQLLFSLFIKCKQKSFSLEQKRNKDVFNIALFFAINDMFNTGRPVKHKRKVQNKDFFK